MKLHCFGHSGHSYKVANYLNLAGLDWKPVFVDYFNGEARSETYIALNEMGEVPVLIDNDVTLTQSGVILDYLIEKTEHFAPTDRREALRWILWDNHKGSSQFGMTRFMIHFLPEKNRSEEINAFLKGRVKAAIKTLENALDKKDFLVGNQLSIADFSCSSYLFYPEDFSWKRADTPNIDAWLSRIENMPNWKHPYDLMPVDQAVINRTPSAKKWHKEVV